MDAFDGWSKIGCHVNKKKRLGFDVSCLCCAVDSGVGLLKALELVGVDQVLSDHSIEQLELVRGWSTIAVGVGGSLS